MKVTMYGWEILTHERFTRHVAHSFEDILGSNAAREDLVANHIVPQFGILYVSPTQAVNGGQARYSPQESSQPLDTHNVPSAPSPRE
jgi:hypothetical protein